MREGAVAEVAWVVVVAGAVEVAAGVVVVVVDIFGPPKGKRVRGRALAE